MNSHEAKDLLTQLFRDGLKAVAADACLPPHLPKTPSEGRTLILGAGKAAAAMAATTVDHIDEPFSGFVVTRYGHGLKAPIRHMEVMEAAHPVPDDMSLSAASHMLALAATLTAGDRLIFLASGGGSSLLAAPVAGLEFTEKQALMRHLLHSGAAIHDINCVRRHLSAIKGGQLAAAAGEADVFSYIISDVPGDSLWDVASGPTVADPTSLEDARAVIDRFGAPDIPLVMRLLDRADNETVKRDRSNWHTNLVASSSDCLTAAEASARKAGLRVINLGPDVEGEARTIGGAHARMALDVAAAGQPTLILSGGETTVTVKNTDGKGGRNTEYALGLALALKGAPGIHALAADTDGIDGSEDNAGAFIAPDTLARASAQGICGQSLLDTNMSQPFFAALDDLLLTGPTRTNVNDFRAILVTP